MLVAPNGRAAQPFIKHGDDQHAKKSSEQRTGAALNARSTEHDCHDDTQFKSSERTRADRAIARRETQGRKKRQQSHERIDLAGPAHHWDPRIACRDSIAPKHQDFPPPARTVKDESAREKHKADNRQSTGELSK